MNDNFNVNDIVRIETMPKVFSQLEKIGTFIDEQTKDIDKLECTEENKQEVKKRRTEINNALKILEDKRKEIKTSLLEPYETFNQKYEYECKSKLQNASDLLKSKIDTIEDSQRKQKEEELKLFFTEWQRNYHLDFVSFDDMRLNITITASLKSLKEEIKDKLEKIYNDIEIINNEDNKDELLLEYRNNEYDYQKAKLTLIERKKQLEEIKQQQEEKTNIEQQEQKQEEKVEEIIAPKEIIEDDEILEVSFTIKASKDKIIKLKDFMKELEIEYE